MKKNEIDISNIRGIAAFMVVAIHVANGAMSRNPYNSLPWWEGSIITSLLRQCVPLFVMISGAMLLRKNENIKIFYKKRLKRIIIPLIFWTLIYEIINLIILYKKNSFQNNYLHLVLKKLYVGEPYYILWYIYMICGLYLITPFIKAILIGINEKRILYLFAIGCMVASGIFGFEQYIFWEYEGTFFMFKSLLYIGYFIMGYLIYEDKEKIKIKAIDYVIIFLSIITIIIGNYIRPSITIFKSDYFQAYNSIPILVAAIPTFKLMLKIRLKGIIKTLITNFSKYSMGIYLIHPLIILIISRIYYIFNFSDLSISLIMPIDIIITAFLSYILSKFMSNSKILNYLV